MNPVKRSAPRLPFSRCRTGLSFVHLKKRTHLILARTLSSREWVYQTEKWFNCSFPNVTYIDYQGRDLAIVGETHDTEEALSLRLRATQRAGGKEIAFFEERPPTPQTLVDPCDAYDTLQGAEYNFPLENPTYRFLIFTSLKAYFIGTYSAPFVRLLNASNPNPFSWSAEQLQNKCRYFPNMEFCFAKAATYSEEHANSSVFTDLTWQVKRLAQLGQQNSDSLDVFSPKECAKIAPIAKKFHSSLITKDKIGDLLFFLEDKEDPRAYHQYLKMLTLIALEHIQLVAPLPPEICLSIHQHINADRIDEQASNLALVRARDEIFVDTIVRNLGTISPDVPSIIAVGERHRAGMNELFDKLNSGQELTPLLSPHWVPSLYKAHKPIVEK